MGAFWTGLQLGRGLYLMGIMIRTVGVDREVKVGYGDI